MGSFTSNGSRIKNQLDLYEPGLDSCLKSMLRTMLEAGSSYVKPLRAHWDRENMPDALNFMPFTNLVSIIANIYQRDTGFRVSNNILVLLILMSNLRQMLTF